MLEDARTAEGQPLPLVSLEAWVLRHDTFVPFGGFTGAVHTVRRSALSLLADPSRDELDVSGQASTDDGGIAGGHVTLTVRNGDDESVLVREKRVTSMDGTYGARLSLKFQASKRRPSFLEVTASLSPNVGYGPADVGPLRVGL